MPSVNSVAEPSWINKKLWIAGVLAVAGVVAYAVSYFFKKGPPSPPPRPQVAGAAIRQPVPITRAAEPERCQPPPPRPQVAGAAIRQPVPITRAAEAERCQPPPPRPQVAGVAIRQPVPITRAAEAERGRCQLDKALEKYKLEYQEMAQGRCDIISLQELVGQFQEYCSSSWLNEEKVAELRRLILGINQVLAIIFTKCNNAMNGVNYKLFLQSLEQSETATQDALNSSLIESIRQRLLDVGLNLYILRDVGPSGDISDTLQWQREALEKRLFPQYNDLKQRLVELAVE